MAHIVLLGDSIFDNAPYVAPGMAVTDHLRACLPAFDRVTMLARDGSLLDDLGAQFAAAAALPDAPARLVVSAGGNDVLGWLGAMQSQAGSVLAAAQMMSQWRDEFRRRYRRMLERAQACGFPLAVATIYDAVPGLAPGILAMLALFNDVILREAVLRGLPVLDLRLVCTESGDYASCSPIEPSEAGGRKIAAALAALHTGQPAHSVVYGPA